MKNAKKKLNKSYSFSEMKPVVIGLAVQPNIPTEIQSLLVGH